jgi:TetR/AcrR family tetracycline transcriptional repressor
MIATYVQGFVLQEQLPMSSLEAHGASPEQAAEAVTEAFRSAPADQYPNVAALADVVVRGSTDEQFSFGVDRMIEGLRTRLPSGD